MARKQYRTTYGMLGPIHPAHNFSAYKRVIKLCPTPPTTSNVVAQHLLAGVRNPPMHRRYLMDRVIDFSEVMCALPTVVTGDNRRPFQVRQKRHLLVSDSAGRDAVPILLVCWKNWNKLGCETKSGLG